MASTFTAGKRLHQALKQEQPLQVAGTINAYTALLAEHAGLRALYLSGSGVSTASCGVPDLGITNLNDVLEDTRRITNTTSLPLLVDIDTGFGNALGIARAIKAMIQAGAAGVHIEDQESSKRCGLRPGKKIVSVAEMCDRLKAAADAKTDASFVLMARTDALGNESLEQTLERAQRYIEAGAEMLFLEGARNLTDYERAAQTCKVPVLANITEFGVTPLFTREELAKAGVNLILYPLSAFRAMSAAALQVYRTILKEGTQKSTLPFMQTREELYEILHYYDYEKKFTEVAQ